MIYLLNKNNMKKLAYIATIACSMFLTTSCVDLTQEPQSFITDEDYIASMDLTGLQHIQCNSSNGVQYSFRSEHGCSNSNA